MRLVIQNQLSAKLPAKLVDELLTAHSEAKRNMHLGGLRLSEVEGGRFCEAAFRILEFATSGSFTAIGIQINTEKLIRSLENLPAATYSDSIRIHIPRALRLVYDIRNKRDAAHLADGIDPNLQDATLVTSVVDWVLAEFLRIYHDVSANDAQQIVAQIVTRKVPIIQDFNGYLKILNPDLSVSEHCLVLLYHRGAQGASFEEISAWVRPKMRTNLRRTLYLLVEEKDMVHEAGDKFAITHLGQREVETKKLIEPAS